jgi:hypothetical protein
MDADVLPEHAFSSVAWLRPYGMHMYRWSGNSSEWTEYAMHLPQEVADLIVGPAPDYPKLADIASRSGCKMWVDQEHLHGSKATFLVMQRGQSGQPSNARMANALDLISVSVRHVLSQSQSQQENPNR